MELDARASAWIRLQCAGVTPRALVPLLRVFGSPEAVLTASAAARERHLPAGTSGRFEVPAERIDAAMAWTAGAPDHGLVAWGDPRYPAALLDTVEPPAVLYTV